MSANHGGGRPRLDLAGQQFGAWLVLEPAARPIRYTHSPGRTFWLCRCLCGREEVLPSATVVYGRATCRHVTSRPPRDTRAAQIP
jgi:hypothetical protein